MNAKGIRIGRGTAVAAFLIIFGGALCFSACAKDKQEPLSAPTNLMIQSETLTWDAVDGAIGYAVEINGTTYRTAETELDIFEITNVPNTVYQMKVIAFGDYKSTADSAWSEPCVYSFEAPKGLSINLATDGKGYEIVVTNAEELTGKIVIPTTANGLPVTAIGKDGFKDCTGITGIILPDGVSFLDESSVFEGCTALERVKLPADLKTFPARCFYGCERLKKIDIPAQVEAIPAVCFSGCESLKQIVIPVKVKEIISTAFNDCASLERISVAEENVAYRSEGNYVYEKKAEGEELRFVCNTGVIPEGVKSLLGVTFLGYGSVKKIEIPASLAELGRGTLSVFNAATEITVSPDNAMFKCEGNCLIRKEDNVLALGLNTSVIPEGIEEIGKYAFAGRTFTTIKLPSSVKTIGQCAFLRCENLKSVKLPYGLTTISSYAFYYCIALREIYIPNSITSIGEYAFSFCYTSVTLPESVTTVSSSAFYFTYIDPNANDIESSEIDVENATPYLAKNSEIRYDGEHPYVYAVNVQSWKSRLTKNNIVPTREGYTFKGWSTTEGGTDVEFGVTEKEFPKVDVEESYFADFVMSITVPIPKGIKIKVSMTAKDKEEILKHTTLYAVWEKNA